MLTLTQELFGSEDTEFKRGETSEDQLPALLDMFGYFNDVTASRREHPTEDLASAIANARVDGEPLSDIDTVSYYLIVATAGHEHHQCDHLRWPAGTRGESGPARAPA